MNQNGTRDNGDMDVSESRYRGSNRRGRGRGNHDRGRGNRDRRGQWRDPEPAVIDVHDNDQFPSITEAGPRRARQQQPIEQPRAQYGHIEHGNYYRGRGRGRYSNQGRGYGYNNYRRGAGRNVQSNMIPGFPFFNEAPRIVYPSSDIRQLPEVDIIQQVEYYFSDHNLIYDQYLRTLMDIEGYVRVSMIHCFKRVASFKLTLEQFINKIRTSDKLEVSENGLVVRVRNDWEKWVRFNDYIRQNELQDISSAELTTHYVRFIRNTYGPEVVIPEEYMMPPQSKIKAVPPALFQTQTMPLYGDGMMSPVPFYPAFDPSMMYSMGAAPLVGYPMYQEFPMEYPYYDGNQQVNDQYRPTAGRQSNMPPANADDGVESISTMVENMGINNSTEVDPETRDNQDRSS